MIEKAKRRREGGERHRGRNEKRGGIERERETGGGGKEKRWRGKNEKGGEQRYRERRGVEGKTAE